LRAMDNNRLPDMAEKRLARLVLRMMVKGVQPVDDDKDRGLLVAAVREHAANQHPDEQMVRVRYRDDTLPDVPGAPTLDTTSPFTHVPAMEASGAAVYAWAGWLDAGFCREMLALHNSVRNPGSRLVIGPWGHGGRWYTSPVLPRRRATEFDHVAEMVRFFDLHLVGRDARIEAEPPIHYFTMGEERWKTASEWPIPGTTAERFYLGAGWALARETPPDTGSDRLRVDFGVGTGVHSRFGKHLTGGRFGVSYPDRARRDRRLLTYTSAVLTEDLEITGEPIVTLYVSSTATDGAFIVYLEDVDPGGTVRCCTDGGLRASARATGDAPYPLGVPFHSGCREQERPLEPEIVTEFEFGLFPVSWLFRAGHRIRVAVAGADKDNFAPVAEEQTPVIELHRSVRFASRIDLPVVP
jgi:uncharacterized protein